MKTMKQKKDTRHRPHKLRHTAADSALPVDSSSVNHKKVPHINNAHDVFPAGLSVFLSRLENTHLTPLCIPSHGSLFFIFSGNVYCHLVTYLGKNMKLKKDQQRIFSHKIITRYFVALYFLSSVNQISIFVAWKPLVSSLLLIQDLRKKKKCFST